MQRCLQLAKLGAGHVSPNPLVGAVLVYNDLIIGEGYHQQYGKAHAEVNCIDNVTAENKVLIAESTLYVSLEPCAHFGKTPPCVDLIIAKKIPRVVIGCKDSNNEVNGKGIAKLRAAGIEVIENILEKESLELNKRFFTFLQKQRPYVILKWAQSLDKKIAADSGKRIFISNEYTNRLVHQWRSEEDAILVGTNTALADDPALTTRLWPGKDPIRLVIDMDLKLPVNLRLLDGQQRTIVFNAQKQEEGKMIAYYKIDKHPKIPGQILSALFTLQIQSLIVEGGTRLLQSFIDDALWDEARVISNHQLMIGNGLNAPVFINNRLHHTTKIHTDTIDIYLPTY